MKLYQGPFAMLDSYGQFRDDTRDYIISRALELMFERDKKFAIWLEQQRNVTMPNAWSAALIPLR